MSLSIILLLLGEAAAFKCWNRKHSGCTLCPGYWYQTCDSGWSEEGEESCGLLSLGCRIWCKKSYDWPCSQCGEPCPTPMPTDRPTPFPTPKPTHDPSIHPTPAPTPSPTDEPTHEPTMEPTNEPTPRPTFPVGVSLITDRYWTDERCTIEVVRVNRTASTRGHYSNVCAETPFPNRWIMSNCTEGGTLVSTTYSSQDCFPEDYVANSTILHNVCQPDGDTGYYRTQSVRGHCEGPAVCPAGHEWSCVEGWRVQAHAQGEYPQCEPGRPGEEVVKEQCEQEYEGVWNNGTCAPPDLAGAETCPNYWVREHPVFGGNLCLNPEAVCVKMPDPTAQPTTPRPTEEIELCPGIADRAVCKSYPDQCKWNNGTCIAAPSPPPTVPGGEIGCTDISDKKECKGNDKCAWDGGACAEAAESCGYMGKKIKVKGGKVTRLELNNNEETSWNVCHCELRCAAEKAIVWVYTDKKKECACYGESEKEDVTIIKVKQFKKAKSAAKAKIWASVNEKGGYSE